MSLASGFGYRSVSSLLYEHSNKVPPKVRTGTRSVEEINQLEAAVQLGAVFHSVL